MIRTQSQAFRQTAYAIPPPAGPVNGINLYDHGNGIGATVESGWTAGATIIDAVGFQPLPIERWTLLAYSVKGFLVLDQYPDNLGGTLYPMYGKFGKILTSLVLGSDYIAPTGYGSDPTLPLQALPSDFTNQSTLWDPASDELPKQGAQGVGGIPVGTSLILPNPRPLQQAEQFGVGIWIMPSLLSGGSGNFPQLSLYQTVFSIVYDDGTPSPVGIP